MAKKAGKPKANNPRIGQQTKTSAKGAHGGGVKFSQISLGSGFKNITGKGINAGKSAAKLPQAKTNISEGSAVSRPRIAFGKGFGTNPFMVSEAKKGSKAKTQTSVIGGKKIKEKKGALTKGLGKPPSEASKKELEAYAKRGKKQLAQVNLYRAHMKGTKAKAGHAPKAPAVKPGKLKTTKSKK
jgi:hypothetical protein